VLLSALRIIAALLFMEHGLMKVFDFPAPQPGVPYPLPLMLVTAGWIEIVGGGLLALGFFTRWTAFICSGEMAAAYLITHAPQSFWPALNGGDPAILYCFLFLYLVFAGPGALSFDELLRIQNRKCGKSK
jgi:putative oxidoreductase